MLVLNRVNDKTKKEKGLSGDPGFTLIELVVASAIIIIAIMAFTVLVINVLANQRTAALARAADRVLSAQIETAAATPWDNLMLKREGEYQECFIEGDRSSTQAVVAGPEIVSSGDTDFTVYRNVVWLPDQVQGWADRSNTPPEPKYPLEIEALANVVTLHFAENPGYAVGDKVTVSNITNGTDRLNGYVQVTAVDKDYNTISYLATSDDIPLTSITGEDVSVIQASSSTAYPIGFEPTGDWANNPGGTAVWTGSNWIFANSVRCDEFKTLTQPKAITVTVVWPDGTILREQTATIIRSRWTEPNAKP